MNYKKTVEIYDKIANKYSAAFDDNTSDNPFIDKFLTQIKVDSKILDIGCGTGRATKYIADKRMNVEGIDLSPAMLKIANQNYPDIHFELCDVRNMRYKDNAFDGIWAGYSLFHISRTDFVKVLDKIHLILKNNGIFALVMQEGEGEVEIDEPFLPGEKIPLTLYKTEELEKLLQIAGFKLIDKDFIRPETKEELPYNKIFLSCKALKS